jgi:hypothetical protein
MMSSIEKVCAGYEDFPVVSREQRKYPRVRINLPLRLTVARKDLIGQTKDISVGGAFIGSSKRLRKNEKLFMVIAGTPPLKRRITVGAEVVQSDIYCLDDEIMFHGMGVRFTNISHRDRILLSALVAKQLRINEIFKSFSDFAIEILNRSDLDKARKGQIIHEKTSLLRLKLGE